MQSIEAYGVAKLRSKSNNDNHEEARSCDRGYNAIDYHPFQIRRRWSFCVKLQK